MLSRIAWGVLVLIAFAAWGAVARAQPAPPLAAFPGAEGFGSTTPGGRGGRVIKVSNLNASGPGSLQAACQASGPRIVVFEVSGVIRGNVVITQPWITIAGQTAPGAGVTIEGMLRTSLVGWDSPDTGQPKDHDIVVRFLRVRPRPGGGETGDCMEISACDNAIFDHLSMSWAEDETVDMWARSTNITFQWCSFEESSETVPQGSGGHYYALIAGCRSWNISVHHSLFAHNENRNPAFGSGPADFRNNIVFDYRAGFVHHGNYCGKNGFNLIGNYYRAGPSTVSEYPGDPYTYPWTFEGSIPYYLRDNWVVDPRQSCDSLIQDPWAESGKLWAWARYYRNQGVRQLAETAVPAVLTHSPIEARDLIVDRAGCWPRDRVTTANVEDARNGTGSWGRKAPAAPSDAWFLEGLAPGSPPPDGDNDGMPDAWEDAHGLDKLADDSARLMPSGYTAIEDYINGLADALSGGGSAPPIGGGGPAAIPALSEWGLIGLIALVMLLFLRRLRAAARAD